MKEEVDPHTGKKWIELNQDEVKLGFLAQCIEAVAEANNCDYLEMFHRLEDVDMTEGYILKCYDALHTDSWENIVSELSEMLIHREAK